MNFQQLPFPYADFCIINTDLMSIRGITQIENLIAKLDGVILEKIEHIRSQSVSFVLYFNDDNVAKSDNRLSIISGLAKTKDKVLLQKKSYKISDFSNLNEDFGQYTAVLVDDDKVSYKTDLFGAGHLYYSENRGFTVVSNRSHFLKLVLEALSIQPTPNPSTIIGGLFSDYHFFWQMPFCHEGKIKEIQLLTLGKKIIQENGKLQIHDDEAFQSLFIFSKDKYDDYLSEFCEQQVENLELLLDRDYFEQCILDLTGGKDSRLCLSLLLHITSLDRVRLFTNDIPNSDDLKISSGLANLLNFEYLSRKPSSLYPLSIDESFNLWRSYFFGEYHRFGISAWSPKGRNLKDIRISGASGEIYKSIWSNSAPIKQALRKSNINDFSRDLITNVQVKGRYTPDQLEYVIDSLGRELVNIPGENLVEKIDHHYMYHANRSHFGLRGFSFYNSCLVFTPLLSKSLFKASKCLEVKDRDNYKVFYDLYKKLAPFLLNVRFDKNTDPFRGIALNKHDRALERIKFTLNEDTTNWSNARELYNESEISMRSGPARMKWADYPKQLKLGCLEAVDVLSTKNFSYLPKGISDYIQKEENTRELSRLYSILYGIIDSNFSSSYKKQS